MVQRMSREERAVEMKKKERDGKYEVSLVQALRFVCLDEKREVSLLVQALHDFRHNCTPTWLFIASGMIDYWRRHHWQWSMCIKL